MVKSSRWKKIKGLLVLLGISFCLAIVSAELILRLLGHYGESIPLLSNSRLVDDPVVDWRYLPNSEVRKGKVVYKFNRSGFRDVDHALEKRSGITKIVVLGDAVTEGYGVAWDYVFAHQLQTELGDKYEVVNIAMTGLNTPQEIHLLEHEGLPHKPDFVVLNFVLNDADFHTRFEAGQRYQAAKDSHIGLLLNVPVPPWVKRALKSSALIYFAKESVENLKGKIFGVVEVDYDYYSRLWAKAENRQKITSGFQKLAELQRKERFKVLVLIWPLLTDFEHYEFGSIHQWVAEEAINAGLEVVDLLPRFSKYSHSELQIAAKDKVKPNDLGHKLGAQVFLNWFRPLDNAVVPQ